MSRVDAPPVIGEHVEHAQDQDEESGRPLRLESHRNHPARTQPDDRHKHSSDAPLSLDDESQKQEDEQDTTGEKETANQINIRILFPWWCQIFSLFLPVVLADGWKPGKRSSSGDHRVTEDHEQSTNDAQVAQEEIDVENEAVSESLNDDYSEKSTDSKFRVFLRDNGTRTGEHSLNIRKVTH
jgi:hypothetical protein